MEVATIVRERYRLIDNKKMSLKLKLDSHDLPDGVFHKDNEQLYSDIEKSVEEELDFLKILLGELG